MKGIKKFKFLLVLFSLLIIFPTQIAFADAYNSNNAYDKKSGSEEAFNLAQKIPDNEILISAIDSNKEKSFQSVGRFVNKQSNMSGTAVAIGDYTILTNNHLVEDMYTQKGKRNYRPAAPDQIKFYPMQTSKRTPYTFSIKDIHMVKGVDLAIVHTNEKISDKIVPMKLASEKSIKSLKYKDKISVVGYAKTKYFESKYPDLAKIKTPQLFKTDGYFLTKAKTVEPQFYINAITRKGNSGSPIINANGELIGIFPNGFNNSGESKFEYNVEEMGYGVALIDQVRKEIIKNIE